MSVFIRQVIKGKRSDVVGNIKEQTKRACTLWHEEYIAIRGTNYAYGFLRVRHTAPRPVIVRSRAPCNIS